MTDQTFVIRKFVTEYDIWRSVRSDIRDRGEQFFCDSCASLAPSNNHSHIFWCPNHPFEFRACMSRSYCFCFKLVSASFNGKCLLWTWLVCQFSDFGGSFKCPHVIEVFQPLVNASRVVISLFDALGANTCHPLSNSGGLILFLCTTFRPVIAHIWCRVLFRLFILKFCIHHHPKFISLAI
jgi:hypothetical protein